MDKWINKIATIAFGLSAIVPFRLNAYTAVPTFLEPLPIYSEDKLIGLIKENKHLEKVQYDDCQLLEDIEARAVRIGLPSYEFLYADMLTWGVCVERDVEAGLHYMRRAAHQGMDEALDRLGRYYEEGLFVQHDKERALLYFREASGMGNLKSRIRLAELLLSGYGSPVDYETTYAWLYSTVTTDEDLHKRVSLLMQGLALRMPENIVARAKRKSEFW